MDKIEQVSIVGLGLIGGSLGLAIKSRYKEIRIIGFDKDQESVKKALKLHAIDESAEDLETAVKGSDIVFMAVPVGAIASIAKTIIKNSAPGCIVTDVGSTKCVVVRKINSEFPDFSNFIGGHPMTGSEITGIDGATADLFIDCYYILTPTKDTDADQYNKLHTFLKNLGAKVIALAPEKHDKIMSMVSHLPHVISSALVNSVSPVLEEDDNLAIIAGGGFRDMTRIAASNPGIWLDIFLSNPQAVTKAIDKFINQMTEFKDMLQTLDKDQIRTWLSEAQQAKAKIQGLPDSGLKESYLRILLSDKPGAISEVTVAIGSKAINIDDMQMIHTEGNRAILECRISGESKAVEAAKEIRNLGYQVQLVKGPSE